MTTKRKRAVPLTDKVVRGLCSAMAAINASPVEALLGCDSEQPLDAERRREMSEWEAAVRWIMDQRDRRDVFKDRGGAEV